MDAMNGLDIIFVDTQNSFLGAPPQEKVLFYAGNECKVDKDIVIVVICALYGLKSSAPQFRNHLTETLGNKLGFKSSLADPNLCYNAITSPDGFEYFLYILVYVGDLLIIDKFTQRYMEIVKTSFTVNPLSI